MRCPPSKHGPRSPRPFARPKASKRPPSTSSTDASTFETFKCLCVTKRSPHASKNSHQGRPELIIETPLRMRFVFDFDNVSLLAVRAYVDEAIKFLFEQGRATSETYDNLYTI